MSTETAIVGRAFVRNWAPDDPWSNAQRFGAVPVPRFATVVVYLDGNVFPKSVERAQMIASGWLEVANRRQQAKTFPVSGSTARFVPWLIELLSLSLLGPLHVLPQSVERENMIFVLVEPVNRLHTM